MIEQGLALTVIGMTFVFLFLGLLIMSMNLLAKGVRILDARYPEKVEAAAPAGENGSEIALAIAVACACTQKR